MHLTLWFIVSVCNQTDVCEDVIDSVYVGGYCGLSEIFGKLCLVGFLVYCLFEPIFKSFWVTEDSTDRSNSFPIYLTSFTVKLLENVIVYVR